ncbi:2-hydroxycarboxylate transporter family protein [Cellulosimicrobium funkei]|nr:2-hydroxycarboxylate transporter family protein [Cellulosimicrobium funkei]
MAQAQAEEHPGAPETREAVEASSQQEWKGILGLPVPVFIVLSMVVLALAALSPASTGMTAAFAVTMCLGGILMWAGSKIPVFNFVGGGVIFCILVPAIAQYFGIFPENLESLIDSFYSVSGFGEFVVAALITGSILGMPKKLLIKAGTRIIVPIIAVLAVCFSVIGLLGHLTGMGAGYAIFYIAGPVLGGGVAAGAIPISEIIAGQAGGTAAEHLTLLVPAVAVANIFCIIAAGGMNFSGKRLGDRFPGFNGNGLLARGVKIPTGGQERRMVTERAVKAAVTGFVLAGVLFVVSNWISSLVPALHAYVFLILICAVLKIFVPLPSYIEESADLWYVFVANAMIPAILVSLSVVAIEIDEVLALLGNPGYMALTLIAVLLAIITAGFVGWLLRLYVIESAIAAGLGLADFGSSGDLAVLQASQRLNLLPFLSISSRIGGGIGLLTLSALAPLLL